MSRAPMRLAAAAAFAALPLLAAADTTAEQAAGLKQQLRAWAAKWVLPDVHIPEKLIEIAPEGDHYRVTIRLAALPHLAVADGGTISAAVHPGTAGEWIVEDPQFASPTQITLLPHRPRAGAEAANPTEVRATFGKSDGRAVIDPSFAAPSTLTIKLAGYDVTVANRYENHTRIDTVSTEANVSAAKDGRVDVTENASAENYSSTRRSGDQPPLEFASQHTRAKLLIAALDPDRVLPFVRALERLPRNRLAAMPAEAGEGAANGAEPRQIDAAARDRQAMRDLYVAFRGIASGGELSETIEGARIGAAGHAVDLDRLGIGGEVATPDDTLNARLALEADGISSADIPKDVQPYVPHHVAMTPSISKINLRDLDALIMAETAPQPDKAEIDARVAALYADGIVVGLDTLAFDAGPARVSGSGKLTALAPDNIKAEAELKATGFDALIAKALETPDLAQAVPLLATIRSLARQEGAELVWSMRAENGVVTVNGHDLANLLGEKPPH